MRWEETGSILMSDSYTIWEIVEYSLKVDCDELNTYIIKTGITTKIFK